MFTAKFGDRNENVRALQKALNAKNKSKLVCDGDFGTGTQRELGNFQKAVGISETDPTGPCYGPQTSAVLGDFIYQNFITERDYEDAAKGLSVEPAALKAFAITESKGQGFFSNGFPVILFERHKFYNKLSAKFGAARAKAESLKHPDICNPNWGGYLGNEREIPRLERAANIDWESAHWSTSWGAFQLMGFNHKRCGWDSLEDFIDAMKKNEKEHLRGVVGYISADMNLVNALRKKNWLVVATMYNGAAGVKQNKYDKKMAENYRLALRYKA